ncbi:hypothetical protein [Streptomyces gilvus]|nr:hypothetical protein [Streptomyces sp. CME 23]
MSELGIDEVAAVRSASPVSVSAPSPSSTRSVAERVLRGEPRLG